MRRLFMLGGLVVVGFLCVASTLQMQAQAQQPAPIPQATKPQRITTGRPEPVPIVFVYRGLIAQSPWARSHEAARKAITEEFSSRVESVAVERVDTASDADRIFRELASRGHKVFFATDPLHADAKARVAAADYDVKVEQSVSGPTLINMRTYAIRHVEQAYLAGIIAAGHTRSRKIGVVAPWAAPQSVAEVNAFALGAQSVDQRITTQVLWTGTRANAVVEIAAAQALTKRGADVLVATTDSSAVAQWVESKHLQVRVIGWHVDQSSLAPRAQAAAVVLDWTPFYRTAVKESFDYWCTKSDTSRGFAEGAIKVVALSDAMSNAASTRLNTVQAALLRRDFHVFVGPLYSSTGAALLEKGVVGGEAWQLAQRALLRAVTEVSLPAVLAASAQSVRWGKH